MKNIALIIGIAFLIAACGNKKGEDNHATNAETSQNSSSVNDEDTEGKKLGIAAIAGSWKLIDYNKTDYDFELKDCDKKSVWKFTNEKDEPLGDGTEVYKLVVEKGENCKKWFAFESKWTVSNG